MSELASESIGHRAVVRRVVGLLLVGVLLGGCGLSSGSAVPVRVGPGSIKEVPELRGVELAVGSKDFTENIVLGYLAELALSAAGAEVRDLTNIQGSTSARNALKAGQIDLTWEYTGTAWISYLGHNDVITDPQEQFTKVRAEDKAHGIDWIAMSPVNDRYAIAMTKQVQDKYGVHTLSDLAALARRDPSAATFCLETEFASRNDGFPGMTKHYGIDVPPGNVKILGTGAVYQATKDASACNFGEVFTTDARILSLDLGVLADDRHFFPQYNAAVNVSSKVLAEHPQIEQVLRPVAERLDNDTMLKLNAQVDVQGKDPADVARDWLVEQGFVTMPKQARP
ncbi:glycine betaine ABC transporter substrate-binding protein [Kutzneria viridogrisea]|uniref:Glycine betaine/carnitine/choline binding protein n=2 Tax=Kutzneria TaxID=43356 RepID=W5VXY3_9PSEU|nr:glycine betaine ABC transporter substrate-binding protein [Kutzneria albida]AHH93427.1 glycine betaine/carnitine/choline binding protein precursor [Kutzneria albida DSM 43870]MBA8929188.1 osmoprotectant transport system substrate-binding protein [Kutzneria viridogrisea]